jgi:lipopolysaccharide export LptBFGC system permease protein LptF
MINLQELKEQKLQWLKEDAASKALSRVIKKAHGIDPDKWRRLHFAAGKLNGRIFDVKTKIQNLKSSLNTVKNPDTIKKIKNRITKLNNNQQNMEVAQDRIYTILNSPKYRPPSSPKFKKYDEEALLTSKANLLQSKLRRLINQRKGKSPEAEQISKQWEKIEKKLDELRK